MVCGSTTAAGIGLASILVPALVVPFVVLNLIGWTAFGIHKHRKHKRQREGYGQGGGYGSAAGAGNTFVTSTGPAGETVITVVPAGGAGSAGSSGSAGGGAGGAGGAGSTGASYTTGGVPVERREVVQTAGGPQAETVVVAQPH
ncbi:hypothetical protein QM012_002499 [Aureobasidium pullulans]|uniref:Uncharacterized protein n=1 Tax=Aureobasidium pullulans TaxID=5580 RepID=A0ABR0TC73_AURPU